MPMTLKREVSGSGPRNASIVVLIDVPSYRESVSRHLKQSIVHAGITESTVRYEYVCEHKCDYDQFERLSAEEKELWYADTKERLSKTTGNIVTVGKEATKALLPSSLFDVDHCYCFLYMDRHVVPALHPRTILQGQFTDSFYLQLALKKAAYFNNHTQTKDPSIIVAKTISDITDFSYTTLLGVDIETTETRDISSIAFASNERVLVVPFIVDGTDYWPIQEETQAWKEVSKILKSDSDKVFHNFIFDTMMLSYHGLEVCGKVHDTMIQAHLLNPELPKGLGDTGRLYFYEPSWKGYNEWKDVKDYNRFWRYNALDAYYTRRLFYLQEEALVKSHQCDLYNDLLQPLTEPVFAMCCRGWRIDESLNSFKEEQEKDVNRIIGLMREIAAVYKQPKLNPASPKQLQTLFAEMGFKVPTKKGKKTTDEDAIIKMALKEDHPIFKLLLEHRAKSKMLGTYYNVTLDEDKRFRFQLTIPGTIEGRFSSQQTPWETGGNSQNIPKEFRKFVIADKGKILINTDLQRADAQVVAWLSRDATLLRLLSSNVDLHTYTANSIFGVDITTLEPAEFEIKRKLGKTANHALNYGMGVTKFMADVLKTVGVNLSKEEATQIVEGYHKLYSGIRRWHAEIRTTVFRDRKLVTPHGRIRHFPGWITDEELRQAYAYIPPTTVADSINTTLLNALKLSEDAGIKLDILGQCHDSLLTQVDEKDLKTALEVIKKAASMSTFMIHGKQCCIGAESMVGYNWKDVKKYE